MKADDKIFSFFPQVQYFPNKLDDFLFQFCPFETEAMQNIELFRRTA